MNIIKFINLVKNIESIDLNIDLLNYYKPIQQLNPLSVPNSYIKFNKYQFINNKYKNGINPNIYKLPLVFYNIDYINNKIIELLFSKLEGDFDINNIIIKKINIKIINTNSVINTLVELLKYNNKCNILVLDHDLEYIYIIFQKETINYNIIINKIKKLNLINDKVLNLETNIKYILLTKLNTIIENIYSIFNNYNKQSKNHIKDKDFYTFVEHIAFNTSFNYLKEYNIKVNNAYLNNFGYLKEKIIKNNKYIKLYYPKLPQNKDYQLLMTNVGMYSITKPYASNLIMNYITKIVNQKFGEIRLNSLVITDATAGIGGDTIAFASKFKKVNSVEIQKIHSDISKHNCELYNLYNINHINDDYTKIYKDLKQDIIFIDSPWGGNQYKKNDKSELKLFGTSLTFNKFIKDILELNNDIILVIKCPVNYSIQDLDNDLYLNKINYNNFEIQGILNYICISLY
jgi:predicted RNA methylase